MRIGIDCLKFNADYVGGTNTYIMGLVEGFTRRLGSHQLQIYVHPLNIKAFEKFKAPNVDLILIHPDESQNGLDRILLFGTKVFKKVFYTLGWKLPFLMCSNFQFRKLREKIKKTSDVLYFPYQGLEFQSPVKTYISLHDIQQFHFPQFFTKRQMHDRRMTYWLNTRYADYIQASTEFMKDDFVKHFRYLKRDQVFVVHEGVDVSRFESAPEISLQKFNLPKDFIFLPAQLWPHKNHITLLKALCHLEKTKGIQIPLVLTGAAYTAAKDVLEFIKAHNMDYVYYLGVVSKDEITALYKKCKFLVMPSLFESSSLPVLEAMAAKKPVLAASIPAIEEMGQTFNLNFFESLSAESLANELFALWGDFEKRDRQVHYNNLQIKKFDWSEIAQKYIQFFEKTIN